MDPLYFGTSERRLYGVHHPPLDRARRSGILLCYPSVQEYMRTHWAFRKLAVLLSREGFHVLRFDYFGTGDSAGDYQESSVSQWISDIRDAAAELKDLADVHEISIVGLQLGATLAAFATAGGLAVRDLVLWEPVVDGRKHLTELGRMQKLKFGMLRHGPRARPNELLGYVLTNELSADIQRVALKGPATLSAERVSIFAGRELPEYRALAAGMHARTGTPAEVYVVPEDVESGPDSVLLATRVLHAMTAKLAESGA